MSDAAISSQYGSGSSKFSQINFRDVRSDHSCNMLNANCLAGVALFFSAWRKKGVFGTITGNPEARMAWSPVPSGEGLGTGRERQRSHYVYDQGGMSLFSDPASSDLNLLISFVTGICWLGPL